MTQRCDGTCGCLGSVLGVQKRHPGKPCNCAPGAAQLDSRGTDRWVLITDGGTLCKHYCLQHSNCYPPGPPPTKAQPHRCAPLLKQQAENQVIL